MNKYTDMYMQESIKEIKHTWIKRMDEMEMLTCHASACISTNILLFVAI